MNYTDITCPYVTPATHPHLARIVTDPANAAKFERMAQDEPAVIYLGIDRSTPENWIIYAACASRTVRDLLESNW